MLFTIVCNLKYVVRFSMIYFWTRDAMSNQNHGKRNHREGRLITGKIYLGKCEMLLSISIHVCSFVLIRFTVCCIPDFGFSTKNTEMKKT